MNINKLKISKNISNELDIPLQKSQEFFNSFIKILKKNCDSKPTKIHEFGTFYYKITPKRIGRNPITKESYIIVPRKKLCLKTSNKIKRILN